MKSEESLSGFVESVGGVGVANGGSESVELAEGQAGYEETSSLGQRFELFMRRCHFFEAVTLARSAFRIGDRVRRKQVR